MHVMAVATEMLLVVGTVLNCLGAVTFLSVKRATVSSDAAVY